MECLFDVRDRGDNSPAAILAEFMSDLSEDCYCAGWLIGTEFVLWSLANSGGGPWGIGTVTAEDAARLLALAAEAGGWVMWKDGVGTMLVPMDEWKRIAAEPAKHLGVF